MPHDADRNHPRQHTSQPQRRAGPKWVLDIASRRDDEEFELIDVRDYSLPHIDEPTPPSMGA
jgi:hypothetical protein